MKSKGVTNRLEGIGLWCVVAGFALYVAVDSGVFSFLSKKFPTQFSTGAKALAPRLASLQDLNKQVDQIEAKVQERFQSLKQADAQLNALESKIRQEKSLVQNIGHFVTEIENQRRNIEEMAATEGEQLSDRIASLTARGPAKVPQSPVKHASPMREQYWINLTSLPEDLRRIGSVAHAHGVPMNRISGISWDEREYLRINNPFKFHENGLLMARSDVEEARDIVRSIRRSDVSEIRVVFNSARSGSEAMERQRALIIRNYFRKLLDGEVSVTMMQATNATVEAGSIEVWVTKE